MKRRLLSFVLLFLVNQSLEAQINKIDSLSNELKKELNDTLRIDVINELAFNYIHHNPTFAADDVAIALEASREMDYLAGQAKSYNVLGGINWAEGNYPTALDYYIKAAKTYESIGNTAELAKCYNNVGEIYKKLNDLNQALSFLQKSKRIIEKEIGLKDALLVYNNIAEVYFRQDSLQKAESYYNQILANASLADTRILAYTYVGLGQIAAKLGDYGQAEEYYYKSMELRKSDGDNRGLADVYIKLGDLLLEQSLYDSSEVYFDKAIRQSMPLKARDFVMQALLGKVSIDSSRHDYQAALYNYLRYSALKDSTFSKEKADQIARLQTMYDTEMLKKENEANQIKVEQQNIVVIAVVMALILTIAVASAFYKQRQVQRTANRLLSAKNSEIEERNKEIERQSAELNALNDRLKSMNEGLEEEVVKRTELLSEQNKVLSHYAFINAHELRAPVANILGLVALLKKSEISERDEEIIDHLGKSTQQLDMVLQQIRQKLENSVDLEEVPRGYR